MSLTENMAPFFIVMDVESVIPLVLPPAGAFLNRFSTLRPLDNLFSLDDLCSVELNKTLLVYSFFPASFTLWLALISFSLRSH